MEFSASKLWSIMGSSFRISACTSPSFSAELILLGDADWLDGAFSAGDLMMVSVLLRLKSSGILDEYPNLVAYLARGEMRPAYKRAFAAQLAVNTGNPP